MTTRKLPPIDYLRKRLRYDPETGKLYWLDCPDKPRKWRTLWAGREAFTATNGAGYYVGAIDWVNYRAHRVIWAMVHGEDPQTEIDHIDGDPGNNRIENLRLADRATQSRNLKMNRTNTSGVMGVGFDKSRGLWRAHIWDKNKQVYLGRFKTREEAIAAREAALKRYGYSDRHGA